MAITQAIANAFKKQLLEGDQNFSHLVVMFLN
jgi:hypothetical protein